MFKLVYVSSEVNALIFLCLYNLKYFICYCYCVCVQASQCHGDCAEIGELGSPSTMGSGH